MKGGIDMKKNVVIYSVKDKIGYLTLNRPEVNNTFNIAMARELNDGLRKMDIDDDVNVVVINAKGKNFCTGIDVNYIGDDKSMMEYLDWVNLMEEMNTTIAGMGKAVIASVHGVAVANGTGLVAACDLAIACESARFGATAVNVGLFCMGPAVPLLKSLGRKRTLELIMTGDIIYAEKALSYGLINSVVPDEDLEEATLKLARKLADKDQTALRAGKKSFYQIEDMSYSNAVEMSNYHFATLCTTESARKKVYEFLNKTNKNA